MRVRRDENCQAWIVYSDAQLLQQNFRNHLFLATLRLQRFQQSITNPRACW